MPIQETQNAREFTRVPIHLKVEIRCGSQTIVTDQTKDLSMKGIYLTCEEKLPVGSICEVALLLEGTDQPVRIDVKGRVMRCVNSGVGIQFTEIELDSYDHLQNLVLHNSQADHDQVEQEIHQHLGLKKRS